MAWWTVKTHQPATKNAIHSVIVDFSGKGTGHEVDRDAMERRYSESVHTFANTINTHEGGTKEGFRSALTSVVNKYAGRTASY